MNGRKHPIQLTSPEVLKKGPIYPNIAIDNVQLFESKLGAKDLLIFQSSYSGASAKQANYVIFFVFEILSNIKANLYIVESYNGKIKDFIRGKPTDSISFIAKTHNGKKIHYTFRNGEIARSPL